MSHLLKRRVRDAKLTKLLHFRSLRHSFTNWLVQGGATLLEAEKLLGHSSAKVTEIYSHLRPEELHDMEEKNTPELKGDLDH